ncbi:MAG: hypothetical protein K6U11_06080 [bacterium]|nr:hypothetical protein [bacterium]
MAAARGSRRVRGVRLLGFCGEAGEQSELDFLVVEKSGKSRRKEMFRLHGRYPANAHSQADILVVSEAGFAEWASS